jgi:hypothetical protein
MRAQLARRGGYPIVMGTGIVAADLSSAGATSVSHAFLAVGGAIWLALLPGAETLTDVAAVPATAVLGVNVATLGWRPVAWCLLVAAGALWLRRPLPSGLVGGRAFLPVVAVQSLVVLGATLSRGVVVRVAGVLLLAVGVALYVRAVARFAARRELVVGAGEQWIAGGALAISALACRRLAGGPALRVASVVLWIAAVAWVPALVAGELRRPRAGRAPARWSSVFPLGMYAASAFAIAGSWHALRGVGSDATWVAVAAWAAVAIGSALAQPSAASRSP